MDTQPFKIQITQSTIEDLRERLARTRWPDEIPGSGWDYGANLAYMQELVDYWRTRFDWHAQEQAINEFPHFRATVDGLGIHFIHERGKGPNPLPLIITHGWPGSFVEMLKIVPMLTDPASYGGEPADSFDVVVPSLPGYGFSDRPTQPGMHAFRIADLWARLMHGLGYRRFGAQGGDWGASVTTVLGFSYPEDVVGIHLNYIPGSFQPHLAPGAALSDAERVFLENRERWYQAEGGYGHIQGTKPQTLAYGLNDSPAGLAAWITEKFHAWGDCAGEVERCFTKDELLTNVTIYWATETIQSSTRLYYEARKKPLHFGPGERIQAPCGVARFPKEIPAPPREWVERCYNVQRWTEMPRGGHFAAMEQPELLAEDIRAFFRPLR
ncbi:MAG TPA: epoxide hydrolase, partial [Roseiflexaceae bacterium]|jgi:pimeloyl-ACP methyl ester carboxylesterase